jgi:hypothetical protein
MSVFYPYIKGSRVEIDASGTGEGEICIQFQYVFIFSIGQRSDKVPVEKQLSGSKCHRFTKTFMQLTTALIKL